MKEVLRDRKASLARYLALVESGEALAALSVVRLRPQPGDPEAKERLVLVADGLTLGETAEMIVNAAKAIDKARDRDRQAPPACGPAEVEVVVDGAEPAPDADIVAAGFADYMDVNHGTGLPKAAQQALRHAFYGGAITVLGRMLEGEPSAAVIAAMDAELRAYCAEMVRGKEIPSHARH